MRWFNRDLGEHIHGSNLSSGASLTGDELRLARREANIDHLHEMYH